MANEARVFAEGVDQVIVRSVTVADGTAIPKGSLLVFSGASRTAIIHTAAIGPVAKPAGFATMSKEANDGITEIGVQRTGVVDAYHDGAVNSGSLALVSLTTVNRLMDVDNAGAGLNGNLSYQAANRMVGRWLESAADGGQSRCALALG